MRKTKKLLAIVSVAALLLGAFGATASAAASTVAGAAFGDTTAAEFSFLKAFGVYQGYEDGTAQPDQPITRAEFAAVVVRMLDKETIAQALASQTPTFTDAEANWAWAWGYVNYATSFGIIQGYPDGTFGPSRNVTHAEALAMVVRALGRDSLVQGTWPTNYIAYGLDLGLAGDVTVVANLPATRAEVAKFVVGAMGTKRYNAVSKVETDPILKSGNFVTYEGLVSAVDAANNKVTIATYQRDLDASVTLIGAPNFGALLNLNVKATAYKGKIRSIEVTKAANQVVGVFDKTETVAGKDYLVLKDGTKVEYTSSTTFVRNQGSPVTWSSGVLVANDDVVITVSDSKASHVDATRNDLANKVISKVEAKTATTGTFDGIYLADVSTVKLKVTSGTAITINGAAATFADLKANDAVEVATKALAGSVQETELVRIKATRNTVSGTIDSNFSQVGATTTYWVVLQAADGTKTNYQLDSAFGTSITPTTTGTWGLNAAGRIRVQISTAQVTNKGKLVSFSQSGSNFLSAVVDIQGSSVTYTTYANADGLTSGNVGKLGTLTVGTDGKLTDFAAATVGTARAVYAIDATNKKLTIGDGTTFLVLNWADVVVYQETSTSTVGAWIGVEGLSVGNKITTSTNGQFILRDYTQ